MSLRRVDTVDGSKGIYDGERWVATFKRSEDLEEYLTLKAAVRNADILLADWHRTIEAGLPHEISLEICEKELRAALFPGKVAL